MSQEHSSFNQRVQQWRRNVSDISSGKPEGLHHLTIFVSGGSLNKQTPPLQYIYFYSMSPQLMLSSRFPLCVALNLNVSVVTNQAETEIMLMFGVKLSRVSFSLRTLHDMSRRGCKEWKFWLGFPSKGNKDLIFCVYSRKTSECFIFCLKYVVCSAFCDAAELRTIKKKTKLNYLFLSFAQIMSMPLHCYELLPIGRWCLQSRQERDLDNVDTWVATKTRTDHTHDT